MIPIPFNQARYKYTSIVLYPDPVTVVWVTVTTKRGSVDVPFLNDTPYPFGNNIQCYKAIGTRFDEDELVIVVEPIYLYIPRFSLLPIANIIAQHGGRVRITYKETGCGIGMPASASINCVAAEPSDYEGVVFEELEIRSMAAALFENPIPFKYKKDKYYLAKYATRNLDVYKNWLGKVK